MTKRKDDSWVAACGYSFNMGKCTSHPYSFRPSSWQPILAIARLTSAQIVSGFRDEWENDRGWNFSLLVRLLREEIEPSRDLAGFVKPLYLRLPSKVAGQFRITVIGVDAGFTAVGFVTLIRKRPSEETS